MRRKEFNEDGTPKLQGKVMSTVYDIIKDRQFMSTTELYQSINNTLNTHSLSGCIRRLVAAKAIEKYTRQPNVKYGIILSLPGKYTPVVNKSQPKKKQEQKNVPLPRFVDMHYFLKHPPFYF